MLVLRLSVSLIEVFHSVRYDAYRKGSSFLALRGVFGVQFAPFPPAPPPRKMTKNVVWFCGIAGFLAVLLDL
jgi:hypothetical protein